VVTFNHNAFQSDQAMARVVTVTDHSLVLSLASRASVLARCFDELQLSLGCVPTMSHPLATSGQTRELLKVGQSRLSLLFVDDILYCMLTIVLILTIVLMF
jgi:hypothetical protein